MSVQQTIQEPVPATAAGADSDQTVGRADKAGRVTAVTYTPEAAITGNSTDSRTLTLVNKGQAGAGTTVIATLAFVASVDGVAFDEKAFTLHATASNRVVAAGDILAFVSTHVGSTGLADPGGNVHVEIGPAGYTDVASSVGTVAQTES